MCARISFGFVDKRPPLIMSHIHLQERKKCQQWCVRCHILPIILLIYSLSLARFLACSHFYSTDYLFIRIVCPWIETQSTLIVSVFCVSHVKKKK